MRRFFILLTVFVFFGGSPRFCRAQMMDDLFSEDDFSDSKIPQMQADAAKKAAAEKEKNDKKALNIVAPEKNDKKKVKVKKEKKSDKAGQGHKIKVDMINLLSKEEKERLAKELQQKSGTDEQAEKKKEQTASVPNPPSTGEAKKTEPEKTKKLFSLPSFNDKPIGQGYVSPIGRKIGSGEELPFLGSGQAKNGDDENMSLFEMRSKKTSGADGESGASDFDIAGVKLNMTPTEVAEVLAETGYNLKFSNRNVPDLDKWKYGKKCRSAMIFRLNDLKRCVDDAADQNGRRYVEKMVFENAEKKETLTVEFTSSYSGNKAFRIFYFGKGDHSLGTTDEAYFFKNKRRQDFLRSLIEKYGPPDDENNLMWGGADFGPTMTASISYSMMDASVLLEDTTLFDQDFENLSIEDAKEKKFLSFGF